MHLLAPRSRAHPALAALLLVLTTAASSLEARAQEPRISYHDNLHAAGSLRGEILTIDLVVEEGMWYPGGEEALGLPMYAFREAEGPLQIPGPLIRVSRNTEVVVNVRNAVEDEDVHLRGLHAHDGSSDEGVRIPGGESRSFRFVADTPGAFLYWASVDGTPLQQRGGIDSQLSGAFVVDPSGSPGDDRVLVLGEYQESDGQGVVLAGQYTINGRSWPRTERIDVQVGETNRWHIVNGSFAGHPMHLHGIHYRVVETADAGGSRSIPEQAQREVVTEVVAPGQTMTMEWEAANAGNWLFHCHIVAHVDPAQMYSVRGLTARDYDHFNEPHMSGMTLGIHAHGSDRYDTDARPSRFLTMELNAVESYFGDRPGISVAFNERGSRAHEGVVPGPPLFLNKDQLVSIEVVNNLDEPTSIHWHGMELMSYYDGVAGFGGNGTSITPEIEPGHSFEVRMQPPRSGTFLYHTHLNDEAQLSAGLYGAMIVSDPTEPFEAETDRIFVIGLLGETNPQGLRLEGPRMGINGSTSHQQQFSAGREYRLRIMNIADNNAGFAVWLNSPAGYEEWIPVAKDGADLPQSFRVPTLAQRQRVSVGETFDFLWTPRTPGPYWLEVRRGGSGEFMGQAALFVAPSR